MEARSHMSQATRRQVLAATGSLVAGAALAPIVTVRSADATPDTMAAAIRNVIGEANVQRGRVKLDLPPLVENGNTVSMSVSAESPMTEADHVKSIHVFNEANPQPNVINFHFGPRAGKASASTRIRLADTQQVVAIAQMSDGSFWSDTVHVVVTLAACLEDARP
jgi:sulfur-oxidizing protein SoxY